MKKTIKIIISLMFATTFANSSHAQEMDELKKQSPPSEKIEPMVMQTDLQAETPAPPPSKNPEFKLPQAVEKAMKENEEEEYRRGAANSPKKKND